MKKLAFSLALVLAVSGCAASANKLSSLRPGMTKQEVVSVLGTPDGEGLDGDRSYMNYRLFENRMTDWEPSPYTVVLKDGKVISYGRENQVK